MIVFSGCSRHVRLNAALFGKKYTSWKSRWSYSHHARSRQSRPALYCAANHGTATETVAPIRPAASRRSQMCPARLASFELHFCGFTSVAPKWFSDGER